MSEPHSECQKLIPLLDAYFDGELQGEELSGVERHLPGCESCRLRLSEIESVTASLRALPRVTLKRDFADDIDRLLEKSKPDVVPVKEAAAENVVAIDSRRNRRVLWGTVAAAAALLLVFAAGRALTGGSSGLIAKKGPADVSPVPSPEHQKDHQTEPEKQIADQRAPEPSVREERIAKATPPVHETVKPSVKVTENRAMHETPEIAKNEGENVGTAQDNRVADNTNTGRNGETLNVKNVVGGTANAEVIALYDAADTPCTEELGLSTDEDGLYALKL